MKKLLALIVVAVVFVSVWSLVTRPKETAAYDNVVFITIDTLRADRLPTYGYIRDVAPFLTELAESSVIFDRAYSQMPHTAPAHASMFTGLYPFQHGVLRNHETLSEEVFNLPMVMRREGVEAVAFPAVGFLNGNVSFAPSPVELQLGQIPAGRRRPKWYLNAEEVTSNFLQWFQARENPSEPFFAWVHYYDVHQWMGSGQLPGRYTRMMKESYTQEIGDFIEQQHNIPRDFFDDEAAFIKMINGYDARIRFVDDQIRRLYEKIEAAGANERTLWVITSDHGEGLGNHNYTGHGEFLYEEQILVPLFFFDPQGRLPLGRFSEMVQHVDLFPTFVDLLGFEFPPIVQIEGQSLVSLIHQEAPWQNHYAFAERRPKDMQSFRRHWEEGEVHAILDERYKLIDRTLPGDEFFDLKEDRFEMNNLLTEEGVDEPFELQRLRDELAEILERRVIDGSEDEPILTDEQIQELRSLGYL